MLTRPSQATKLDSGAEAHFTSDIKYLENPKVLEHPIRLSQLAGVPSGDDAFVTHVGNLKLYCSATKRTVKLSNVYCGDMVKDSLMSVGVLDAQGYKIVFYNGKAEVFDETGQKLCVGSKQSACT